eukprot:scaffold1010_cov112-Skeletonema_marinoi.AAC.1
MSSSKRPGTVDYSKWDHFEDSDESEDEEDFDTGRNNQHDEDNDEDEESNDDSEEEDGEEEYSSASKDEESGSDNGNKRIVAPRTTSNTHPQRRSWTQHNTNRTMQRLRAARPNVHAQEEDHSVPPPSLAALQRAWNTDLSTITRPCSNCFQPDAKYRCSRCQLVRYCNVTCQVGYHPIHKLECIDAGQHQRYWGMFHGKKSEGEGEGGGGVDDFVVLRARRSSKRRRALQRAAAAAAVERARRARMAQGGAAKGGGGKGKGAEEREEECSICQSEFTVRGDGGECLVIIKNH